MTVFASRTAAGRLLGRLLYRQREHDEIVLGLNRGGIPVAVQIAAVLAARLDVLVVSELAHGVVLAEGCAPRIDRDRVARLELGETELAQTIEAEIGAVDDDVLLFRGRRPFPPLEARPVVLADDGSSTLATLQAAIDLVRERGAARIVLAVPIAPRSMLAELEPKVDEVLCLEPLDGPSRARSYLDDAPLDDGEVLAQLHRARLAAGYRVARMATTPRPPAPVTIGGRYALGALLGTGGMGQVSLAEDLATGRTVAIKRPVPPHRCDAATVARFSNEADATSRLGHPNVVHLLDHGTADDGAPFLVLERLHGETLGVLIRQDGALPLARILRITSQLLDGLIAIHAAGFVHGDVKSDNIMVDAQAADHTTIFDLGIASSSSPPPASPTATEPRGARVLVGTPDYAAPEVVRGEAATVASDLYGVGVVLYEQLTGTTPFSGGDADEVFVRHITDRVVPPSLRCPRRSIPPALERLILQALEKLPEARPHDAASFAQELSRALPATYANDDAEAAGVRDAIFTPAAKTVEWRRPTLIPTVSRVMRGRMAEAADSPPQPRPSG